MSASAVLTQLKEAGVSITVADGQLKLKGPKSALNEDVLSELRAIKAELINILSAAEPVTQQQPSGNIVADWRAEVALVKTNKPEIDKLKSVTLRFLDSHDAIAAVENGWDAVGLFGMHEGNAPKERIDCWGLVLFLAWGVHGCTVETVDQKVWALRTRSGAVQTLRRSRANSNEALPWWRHPGITDTIEDNSDE